MKRIWTWLAPRWESLAAKALVLAAVVVFIKLATYIDRPVVDDALISIAYGKSFFDGDGFRVTPYSQVSEGYSNPTWTVLLGILERLHINAIGPAKTVGMLLSASALPLVMLWGPISQKRKVRLEDAVAPLFACTNASLIYWALGGLENGILVFLIAAFGALIYADRTRRVAIALGLCGAALALTRPEAPLYAAMVGLPWLIDWLWRSRFRPKPTRNDAIALATCVIPVAIYFCWRRVYFGAWLPNTYYAKQSWFVYLPKAALKDGVNAYLMAFFNSITPLFYAACIGLFLSFGGGWKTAKSSIAAGGVGGLMFFFAWFATADWMKEFRFLGSAVPFLAYPIGAGISAIRNHLPRPVFDRRRWLRHGLELILASLAIFGLYESTKKHETRWKLVKAQGGDTPRVPSERPTYGADLRAELTPFHVTHPMIGIPDLGYLALGLRDWEILDVAGLADVPMARNFGNPAAMKDYFANEGYPTLLLVWGPSNILFKTDILSQYRASPKNGSNKIYKGVTPDADDRCPDGKPAALADATTQMLEKIRADLGAQNAVRALARWRCYLTYRTDADLPAVDDRLAIAKEAESAAKTALAEKQAERALRDYSLCAVMGARSWTPSTSCRMRAEKLRVQLFPRPPRPKS